jgi:hypothetical protein
MVRVALPTGVTVVGLVTQVGGLVIRGDDVTAQESATGSLNPPVEPTVIVAVVDTPGSTEDCCGGDSDSTKLPPPSAKAGGRKVSKTTRGSRILISVRRASPNFGELGFSDLDFNMRKVRIN